MQDFVFQETEGQYPKKMVATVFGKELLDRFKISVGVEYVVNFDIDAREYNGRWFNSVKAWKVEVAGTQSAQAVQGAQPLPTPSSTDLPPFPPTANGEAATGDNLPF